MLYIFRERLKSSDVSCESPVTRRDVTGEFDWLQFTDTRRRSV